MSKVTLNATALNKNTGPIAAAKLYVTNTDL